mmetsp:Transcript_26445/g.53719  ORF Transcript_26445/g.53719 Transcript_26445/m.53719 type:complete len:177 (+) Transcript_26445:60-590(+)
MQQQAAEGRSKLIEATRTCRTPKHSIILIYVSSACRLVLKLVCRHYVRIADTQTTVSRCADLWRSLCFLLFAHRRITSQPPISSDKYSSTVFKVTTSTAAEMKLAIALTFCLATVSAFGLQSPAKNAVQSVRSNLPFVASKSGGSQLVQPIDINGETMSAVSYERVDLYWQQGLGS